MEGKMFVDVNVIQALPPSCVNRDDTGSPKSAMYGGVRRARVSSQSWKKAMRDGFKSSFDECALACRTMKIIDMVSSKIIQMDQRVDEEQAKDLAKNILKEAIAKKDKKDKNDKKKKTDSEEDDVTKALFFMSNKQAENLATLAIKGNFTSKDAKNVLNAENGVEISLFGRMVADDPTLNVDASCQVAHAISTHRVDNEYDYYTAVDDMSSEDNAGAAMIGVVEFNSSTMYRYSTLAVHDLAKNLSDSGDVSSVVREYVRQFVMSMPTGKQNTFANRTVPYAVYIAIRKDRPVNLVEAFENPVKVNPEDGGFNALSVKRMVDYEKDVESMFVEVPAKVWCIGKGLDGLGQAVGFNEALEELSDYISKEM